MPLEGDENIGKPSYFNLPPDIGFTLFTPIKGRIDSLTVYIYKAETCTNVLPGISVRVLASHFGFVIATSGPQGGLIHMYDISKPFSKPLLDNDSRRSFHRTCGASPDGYSG
jgi:hypothetical protein